VFTRRILIAAAMAASAVATPAAAATKPANGHALILLPLTLTKIDDLDFGMVVSGSSYGTVSLNAGTGARTFAGGLTGASTAGVPAYFGGAGSAGQLVVIVVAPPAQLSDGNGHTVDVIAMSLDNANNPLRVVDPVTKTFFVGVGGVLGINANQVPGTYSSTFQVTANYL
jgi:Domain of unknown function (DUF4402)